MIQQSKGNKNIHLHKACKWMFIIALFIVDKECNNPNTHQLKNEEKMWYIHAMHYYSAIQKWSIDPCYNMDEPWRHYTKWKKPVTKGHIFYDSIEYRIYRIGVTYSEIGNSTEIESRLVVTKGWGYRENGEWLTMGLCFLFWDNKNVLNLDCSNCGTTLFY